MNKKDLVFQYKNKEPQIGVFQIKNVKNGKVFIESASNLDKIWNRHHFQLNMGGHPNKRLQQEWNQFGEQAFTFEILSELKVEEGRDTNYQNELKKLERLFIEEIQPFGEKGYH